MSHEAFHLKRPARSLQPLLRRCAILSILLKESLGTVVCFDNGTIVIETTRANEQTAFAFLGMSHANQRTHERFWTETSKHPSRLLQQVCRYSFESVKTRTVFSKIHRIIQVDKIVTNGSFLQQMFEVGVLEGALAAYYHTFVTTFLESEKTMEALHLKRRTPVFVSEEGIRKLFLNLNVFFQRSFGDDSQQLPHFETICPGFLRLEHGSEFLTLQRQPEHNFEVKAVYDL